MENLETTIAKRIARDSMRDLPKYVYRRGKSRHLYFIRNGGCVRMSDPVGSPEFEAAYADALARFPRRRTRPVAKKKETKPWRVVDLPSAPFLHEVLIFQPDGSLVWRERGAHMFSDDDRFTAQARANMWNGRLAGKRADIRSGDGRYRHVQLMGKKYLAHRIIWKMVYGDDPEIVDHINGNGQDNRIANLRDVNAFGNQRNRRRSATSTTDCVGVTPYKGRWRANISGIFLGIYESYHDAVAARKEAEKQLGFHENHGRAYLAGYRPEDWPHVQPPPPFGHETR